MLTRVAQIVTAAHRTCNLARTDLPTYEPPKLGQCDLLWGENRTPMKRGVKRHVEASWVSQSMGCSFSYCADGTRTYTHAHTDVPKIIRCPACWRAMLFVNRAQQVILAVFRPRRSRSAAAYSRQTFPWTICRSVGPSVRAYVRRSVQCIVEKRRIGSGCRLASQVGRVQGWGR